MPFDLSQAAYRLGQVHRDAVAFRRALLDLAFAGGCPVSEQAVALEHGEAVMLRMASVGTFDRPTLRLAVLDLDPPGRAAIWAPELDSLGGPTVAQTWAVAVHALLRQAVGPSWELLYARGPAFGLPAYLGDLAAQTAATVQLVPCPTQPLQGEGRDALGVETRADGLRVVGLIPPAGVNVQLRKSAGGRTLTRDIESVMRQVDGQMLIAVAAEESIGPAPAGLDGPIWRLPGRGESEVAARGLAARLAEVFSQST